MYIDPNQGAGAPIVPPVSEILPNYQFENIRHLVFGSLTSVQLTIQELHSKHYAEPNDWSKPISTGRPNEVMVILTKKVRVA
ncbi:MAG: hypothetical protein AAF572_15155 [Cyanobacteria bacterium P01_B01_bin.77]